MSTATPQVTLSTAGTVAAIYEAFSRGDVPTILGFLADDISWDADWADNYAQRTFLGHFTPRRGHAGVVAFFEELATYTVHDFQVLDIMTGAHQVVAQIVIEITTPSAGRLRDEELHLWTFGPDGLVTTMRHYIDTAKHLAAGRGEDTTVRPS